MSRLSEAQLERVHKNATAFQENLVEQARGIVPATAEGGAFFAALFRLAGEIIESDVEGFCDRAEATFEEIEAFGQEPQLDGDWLGEVVGDRDTFNFSTENLVSDLISPPRRKRGKKELSVEEQERIRAEVEAAIIDENQAVQSFEQALAVAHGEDPYDWIDKIKRALGKEDNGTADFWTLLKKSGLSPGELFLGLLLGQDNWELRQISFYSRVSITLIV